MERGDPNVASAVAELREASNTWWPSTGGRRPPGAVLLQGHVLGPQRRVRHYVNFGPTAPIPAKRKARISRSSTLPRGPQRGR
ncbi:unnamed protein product [Spirodela intermedia]|uniref:Uncharacterized protein n=1 Tax=Spirodela intermedia TaxID=51605 RepID=A0A7I8IFT1_SPIIN|nr:unnamed protein product [Spirodela intermedia]CAA6656670.1 unnamed protein product [Spirodela intermedia]